MERSASPMARWLPKATARADQLDGRSDHRPDRHARHTSNRQVKKVPYDHERGRYYDMHHRDARADGGSDDGTNLEPMRHDQHVEHHKKNDDFARWGKRRGG